MIKTCPQCRKTNDIAVRICPCGWWFDQEKTTLQFGNEKTVSERDEFNRSRRARSRRKIRKYLIICVSLVLALGAFALIGGFFSFSTGSEFEKTDSLGELSPNIDKSINPPVNQANNAGAKNAIEGRVTEIIDGETIKVTDKSKQEYRIRLGGIDAPALNELFGGQARENLAGRILGKPVLIVVQKNGADGVSVGKVLFEGKNINLEQVRAGLAKVSKDSAEEQQEADRRLYANAETTAQNNRLGLWSGTSPNPNSFSPTEEVAQVNPPLLNTAKISGNKTATLNSPPTKSLKTASIEAKSENRREPPLTTNNQISYDQITPTLTPLTTDSLLTGSESQATESEATEMLTTATARCADGTISYSASRSGTCSRHGGVAEWLGGLTLLTEQSLTTSPRTYQRGLRGGCYYINSNGNKTYVDRSLCN